MKIISFEGFEYSGKSTQIKLLKDYFKKNKIISTFTRETGGNKDLEKIRKVILNSDFNNLSLIMYFFASRFALLSSLKSKGLLVFDRFFDSTYAYQKTNNEEKKLILNLIKFIEKKYIPNITFYLKIDNKSLFLRKKNRGVLNKFDQKYLKDFTRIQNNYNEISKYKVHHRKFITLDASKSENEIHQQIISYLKKWKLIK
ncbi:MAG: dTMP kinase [Pelagibacteraceae bacterium]